MSTRAIRAEIALKDLDPRQPLKCDKNGRLVEAPKPAAVSAPVPAVEEKKPLKNALVQIEETKKAVEEPVKVETVSEPVVVEETTEAEETPKKVGKKKKAVSTDL